MREPELLNLHVKAADQHLARLQQQDFVRLVRTQIAALLESAEVTLERVAEQLRSRRAISDISSI